MAVGADLGPLGPLAGKARSSGDNTGPQWAGHGSRPAVSRHYAAATCRRRFARVVEAPGPSDSCRSQLCRHDHSGVAETNPIQVQRLVFLDAFIPENGQSVLDLLPPEIGAYFRDIARKHGDGWRLPGGEGQLDLWGLKPGEAREFVRARLCDFSLRCFEEQLHL